MKRTGDFFAVTNSHHILCRLQVQAVEAVGIMWVHRGCGMGDVANIIPRGSGCGVAGVIGGVVEGVIGVVGDRSFQPRFNLSFAKIDMLLSWIDTSSLYHQASNLPPARWPSMYVSPSAVLLGHYPTV